MATPFTKEQIKEANNIDIVDIAKQMGYEIENGGRKSLHAKNSGGLYFFKDSNKFYHFSTDKGGGAIDFVMSFGNKNFTEAVEQILGERISFKTFIKPKKQEIKKDNLTLPERENNVKRIYWYLCNVRGIDKEIISNLIKEKKLYQEKDRGNCVFVGYDENKNPKYCAMRGTNPQKSFKMDKEFSDKSYPFVMEGTSNLLFVLESPIDVMSHATLTKLHGVDFKKDHRISLGCLSDGALKTYLDQHKEIKKIVFALDNDCNSKTKSGDVAPNYGQVAALKFCNEYKEMGYSVAVQTPKNKDFNEDLQGFKEIILQEEHYLEEEEELEI